MIKPSISIFFPFLNDWGTVGSLISLAIVTVKRYTDDWEVIIVNDGSTNENTEALEKIVNQSTERTNRKVRIIHHVKNRGYGGALRSGFEAATKDYIFYTDCDAQYDPRELGLLIEALKPKTGMVNGFKIKRNDPWYRTVIGRAYHYAVKFAFKLPISDTDCDFRLIRRDVFNRVKLFENTGTICCELVKKISHFGYIIEEVAVHHFWRTSGKSQFFNFGRVAKTFGNLFKLWWKLIVLKDYIH